MHKQNDIEFGKNLETYKILHLFQIDVLTILNQRADVVWDIPS